MANNKKTRVVVTVTKANVLGVVEGISVMLSQQNGGTPTFEELWASESESSKLDIYYREGVNDLETQLRKFSGSTVTDFSLDGNAEDVSFSFKPVSYWEERLTNLLSNKVKEYLVHSIMGGWLSGYPEFTHADYLGMAVNDLADIKNILLKRNFNFPGVNRATDSSKEDGTSGVETSCRGTDVEKPYVQDKLAEYRHLDLVRMTPDEELSMSTGRNGDNASNCFWHEHVNFANDLNE